jgi:hypothetical protein
MLTTPQTAEQRQAAQSRVDEAVLAVEAAMDNVRTAVDALLKGEKGAIAWELHHSWHGLGGELAGGLYALEAALRVRDAIRYQRRLSGVLTIDRNMIVGIADIMDIATGEQLGDKARVPGSWSRARRDGDIIEFDAKLLVFPEQRQRGLESYENLTVIQRGPKRVEAAEEARP